MSASEITARYVKETDVFHWWILSKNIVQFFKGYSQQIKSLKIQTLK